MIRTGWILSALLFLAPGFGLAQTLDEAAVRKMLAEVDRAVAARNVDGVARHISESATLTLEMTANGETQRTSMSKPQYVEAMRQTWSTVDAYDYRRSNEAIAIERGRAVVTSTVVETITVQGRTLRATSQETSVIEMVGGRPQLTSSTAKTQL